jgi:(1->4)-alpha-D-glucan 1-alpha-D-glucosylmutase
LIGHLLMRHLADTDHAEAGRLPRATYRIQFNRHFMLAHARALVPYLHDLGVSHIYASPLLKASPGSTHGYDICDFHELNPELGTLDDFANLHGELARHQMGLILDVVPNHMGISGPDNLWWRDLLARGSASPFARCFDIDWQSDDPRLRGKVAMPILGERYHDALRDGTISLAETDGGLCLKCAGQNLPVSPETVAKLLQRLAKSGQAAESHSISHVIEKINHDPQSLDEFVAMQNYLPMFWRNGDAALNYRRFFTISSLAGIRIEDDWVFDQAFGLVKQWLDNAWIDGLRVDHPDGLRHPKDFLRRLRGIAPKSWIVVEKILAPSEPLELSWPVDGTTGYDFLNNVCGLFIDPQAEKPLSDFYTEFTGDTADYAAHVRAKKHMVLRDLLTAETHRLTELLVQVSARHWECRDFTRAELRQAWAEIAAAMPVYRTYAAGARDEPDIGKRDTRIIRAAVTSARAQCHDLPGELFDFLEELLLLRRRGRLEDEFVLRFQQVTVTVMAKAVEDTAFYCYARFLALNEVGGDPSRFGFSPADFNRWCHRRQSLWPGSMAATSTHDTKHGGDVRTRLAVLSEIPDEWIAAVRRWSQMNEAKHLRNWPGHRAEYVFYQTLVGAWPLTLERALAAMEKAAREAKDYTDWSRPVKEYEDALRHFITAAFGDSEFVACVEQFVSRIMDAGWINSLAQTLAKLTAPGVPDIYQGADLWDLTLADPDNRQPVDFALRKQLLTDAKCLSAGEVWRRRATGMPNLWLIWKTLDQRRSHPDLFGPAGRYDPLPVRGTGASHVLAFMRGEGAVTVIPRQTLGIDGHWGDTIVEIPPGCWRNALTLQPVATGRMTELIAEFPVAFLLREGAGNTDG